MTVLWELVLLAARTLAVSDGLRYQDLAVDSVWREGRLDGMLDAVVLASGMPRTEAARLVSDVAERYFPDGASGRV